MFDFYKYIIFMLFIVFYIGGLLIMYKNILVDFLYEIKVCGGFLVLLIDNGGSDEWEVILYIFVYFWLVGCYCKDSYVIVMYIR